MGECGIRGGYSELVNFNPEVQSMLLKSISAKLCPTVVGQVTRKLYKDAESKRKPKLFLRLAWML